MAETRKFSVGLIYFNEEFGKCLEERLNAEPPFADRSGALVEVKAEHVAVHEVDLLRFEPRYEMLIDRASHYFRHSLGVFMMYAFAGVRVVNNPMSFHYFIANKDLGFYVANALGVPVPPTWVLPPKETKHLEKPDDFRFHRVFDWHTMTTDVGFPAILKPAEGRAAFHVSTANYIEELWHQYDKSGDRIMTLQKKVPTSRGWQVRCICVGRTIIPLKYVFREGDMSEYLFEENFLTAEEGRRVIDCCKIINRAFGYEMNSCEFFLDDEGTPWAIDFNNPVPDGRREKLGEVFFKDYIEAFVRLVRETAIEGTKAPYLPELNPYAEIARKPLSREERFAEALALANRYYQAFGA